MTVAGSDNQTGIHTELHAALNRLLLPIASLCLAKGVSCAVVEEQLKAAFVHAADALVPDAPCHGKVSRISTATGLLRREVTRLIAAEPSSRLPKQPASAELFARWTSEAAYCDESGHPLTLKRLGAAPSFEVLAHSITRDIHPRCMLDELLRLQLAAYDDATDTVTLTRTEFVPYGDAPHYFAFLGSNVGDHLLAAVQNISGDGNDHLEQAVFADDLSEESVRAVRSLFMVQWQNLREAIVPELITLIEEDHKSGRTQNQRVRLGLYSYNEAVTSESDETAPVGRAKRKYLQGVHE